MKISDATVLITGANRGLGLAFARGRWPGVRARSTRRRETHPA